MTATLRSLTLVPAVLLLASCGGGNDMNTPPAAELESMTIALSLEGPAAGELVTATANGHYADGTDKPITAGITWRSTSNEILEPVASTPGQFKALKMGVAQILATIGTVQTSARVTVGVAKVATLELVPSEKNVGDGGTVRVNVIATYTDDTRETVTKNVAWETSNSNVLLPSSTDLGYLVSFGEGNATVTATLDGKSVTGTYTVTPPAIDYMVISPSNVRIDPMRPVQFSVMGHYTDGRYVDVSTMVTWSSSDPAIAAIDASGMATAVGDGNVVISATIGDVSAMATARTVTSGCPYPDDATMEVRYDTVMPALFWIDAFDEGSNLVDVELSDYYCDATTHPTIIFVVTAGWCPYCPDYMRMVEGLHTELEAAGSTVMFVVAETASGAPASNMDANAMVLRETMSIGKSFRVGDGATAGGVSQPFGRAVSALPNAFVVRTRDMRVIADQNRSDTYLDLVSIVNDPERLW